MFEALIAYFEPKFKLTEADKEIIRQVFIPKKLLKGEFLLREGEACIPEQTS